MRREGIRGRIRVEGDQIQGCIRGHMLERTRGPGGGVYKGPYAGEDKRDVWRGG